MIQTTIFKEEVFRTPAYKTAVALIERYVIRGDSYEQLKRGQGGMWTNEGHCSIGGFINGKKYGTDKIVVMHDADRNEVNEVFDLKKVYNDIKESRYGR